MVWFRARTRPVNEARNAVTSLSNVIKRPPLRVVLANGASQDRIKIHVRNNVEPDGHKKSPFEERA